MLRVNDFFCHLVGRDGGRNENDLVEPECFPNLFRTPQMTQMDGIEGPSEETDPCTRGLLFYFSILPYIEF